MEWLGPRGRDGGIDTLTLPIPTGGISMCGKHAVAPDVHAALDRCGATTVVCLVEEHEIVGHWPGYVEWLRANDGGSAVWFPVHDLHAPPVDVAERLLLALLARIDDGEHLLLLTKDKLLHRLVRMFLASYVLVALQLLYHPNHLLIHLDKTLPCIGCMMCCLFRARFLVTRLHSCVEFPAKHKCEGDYERESEQEEDRVVKGNKQKSESQLQGCE